MMRPSVPSPTGTAIGWPVSFTSWPRTRPSEVSIATVRTVDSPRCCATSSTRRLPWFLVSSAFRIAGSGPSNCTSTTAPMTWVMRPTWVAMWSSSRMSWAAGLGALERLGARDHLAGVAGRIVHRAHARALLGRGVLQQRAKHLRGEITRHQLGEDVLFLRLVFIARARFVLGLLRHLGGNDPLPGRDLRDH